MPTRDIKNEYINALKDAGKLLIEQAEHFMNDVDTNKIADFTIWLAFKRDSVPTMEINKEYVLKTNTKENDI